MIYILRWFLCSLLIAVFISCAKKPPPPPPPEPATEAKDKPLHQEIETDSLDTEHVDDVPGRGGTVTTGNNQ